MVDEGGRKMLNKSLLQALTRLFDQAKAQAGASAPVEVMMRVGAEQYRIVNTQKAVELTNTTTEER